jgi:hypothetical protein
LLFSKSSPFTNNKGMHLNAALSLQFSTVSIILLWSCNERFKLWDCMPGFFRQFYVSSIFSQPFVCDSQITLLEPDFRHKSSSHVVETKSLFTQCRMQSFRWIASMYMLSLLMAWSKGEWHQVTTIIAKSTCFLILCFNASHFSWTWSRTSYICFAMTCRKIRSSDSKWEKSCLPLGSMFGQNFYDVSICRRT